MTHMQHNPFLSRTGQFFWRYAGAVSVRVKVLGIVLGVIILLGIFIILQMRAVLTSILLWDLGQQGIAITRNIVLETDMVMQDATIDALGELFSERRQHFSSPSHNTQVDYIALTGPDGAVLMAEGLYDPAETLISIAQPEGSSHELFVSSDETVTEVREDTAYGTLHLGLSQLLVHQTVNEASFNIFSVTIVMVAVGFAAAFLLTWVLTRPLTDLVSAASAVERGDLERTVPRWADDEIGELATAFNAMTASLKRADEERGERERLREQYISGIIEAQENERQRIARELHDSTSQSLTSLLVGLQNLHGTRSPDELPAHIETLRGIVAHTLDEVRQLSWQLRPSILDDLGLKSALAHHIGSAQAQYGLPVDLVIQGLDDRLPAALETTIYRIVQESLTNVVRYAKATAVSVFVGVRGETIRVIVEDNGVGFDPAAVQREKKSLGLQGIRERAGLFGGTLTIESSPGAGATLVIEIPYPKEQAVS